MNLDLTEEQQALVKALRDFAEREIRPAARECEEAGEVSDRLRDQLFEMGVAAPFSKEFGGQGALDAVTSVLVAEELAYGDPGIAYSVLGSGLAVSLVDLAGTQSQRRRLLPALAEQGALPEGGRRPGAVALAERDAGTDLSRLEAVAQPDGDSVRLFGVKYGVPAFPIAAVRLVVARYLGAVSAWLVPPDAELSVIREDKLGLRSARTYRVCLVGVEVDGASRIGDRENGRRLILALLRARLLDAGIALGLARAALDYASEYARRRLAFGRPIGVFQGVSFKIADRAIDLEAARLLTWKAACAVDRGHEEAERLVMSACGHAVAAGVAGAEDAVQILGGHGYMRDHPVELWYRDAMTLSTLHCPSMVGDLFLAREHERVADEGSGGDVR
ncbi:MAG: acyl-CoA dehydrogenase family protein [Actinomycetota bacterium]